MSEDFQAILDQLVAAFRGQRASDFQFGLDLLIAYYNNVHSVIYEFEVRLRQSFADRKSFAEGLNKTIPAHTRLERRELAEREGGKKGPPEKRKNTEQFNKALRETFLAWMARNPHCRSWSFRLRVTEFREVIRAHPPLRLRPFKKRLTRNGRGCLSVRQLCKILRPALPVS